MHNYKKSYTFTLRQLLFDDRVQETTKPTKDNLLSPFNYQIIWVTVMNTEFILITESILADHSLCPGGFRKVWCIKILPPTTPK